MTCRCQGGLNPQSRRPKMERSSQNAQDTWAWVGWVVWVPAGADERGWARAGGRGLGTQGI